MGCKLLLFDWGDTLAPFNCDLFVERNARMLNTTPYKFLSFVFGETPSVWEELETFWTKEEIHRRLTEHFGVSIGLKEFIDTFNIGLEPPDWHRAQNFLRKVWVAGVRLALVSNINHIHREYVERTFRQILWFFPYSSRFFSCDIGLRKGKDPAFFRYVLERCRIYPEDAVLIDDRQENLDGFALVGGRGVLFREWHTLEFKLIQLGVLSA